MRPLPHRSIVVTRHAIERHAEERPAGVAVVAEDGSTWTWAQALREANRAGWALAARGVARGDRVLLFLPNGVDWLRAWWGIASLGAVMVPVNTAYRGETLRHVCSNAGARLIVTDLDLGGRLAPAGVEVDVMDPAELTAGRDEPPPLAEPLEPWDVHAVNYTSGTTGPAKGVLTPYLATYMGGHGSLGAGAGLTPEDRWLIDLPLFHVGAQMASLSAVSVGAGIAVRPAFAGRDYWRVAADTGATRSLLVGTMANFLLQQEPTPAERTHGLVDVFVAPMVADPPAFCERFGMQRLFTAYGQTEISAPLDCPPGAPIVPGSCGRPRDGVELRIVDQHDIPVPVGEVGELIIRTERPWEMNLGYLGNPEATVRAWRNGWFHTGDAFRRDADDNYFFVDRRSDTLRRRGENISSFQVEVEVVAHPDVAEAACVAAPGDLGEDEVKVLVVPVAGRDLDLVGLIEFLVPRMPHFMIPRYVEVVDELPKTQTMRVQKFLLRQQGNTDRTWDREAAGLKVTRAGLQPRGPGGVPRKDSPPADSHGGQLTKQIPLVNYLVLDGDGPRLRASVCRGCGARFFDRRNACSRCFGDEFDSALLADRGRLRSFTIVHRAAPGVPAPYISAVVDLDGGGCVKANLFDVAPDPADIQLGMPVKLRTWIAGTDDDGTEAVGFGFTPDRNGEGQER